MLFTREKYEKYGASECTSFETQEAARRWWIQELSDAENFVESFHLNCGGEVELGSVAVLQYNRPLLNEVLRDIQEIEAEVLESTLL